MNQKPEFAQELITMAEADQKMRHEHAEGNGAPFNEDLDQRNFLRLKEIVAAIGWPTISKVGRKASHAAWILVQHGRHGYDLAFMKECLQMMWAAKDDLALENIAFLEDRVRMHESRPQLYGTQYQWRQNHSQLHLYTVEDPVRLDERRNAMGMSTFKDADEEFRRERS